ncbi:MAG: transketolase family protein [Bacteroidetes bacterium]|nr:MAG: transketolase family protein [Spirochaetota bacterium]RKX94169.1 MAG: transketolase family protein [Spirochaetota bacterium]RLD58071.1 MAG: transketolase family protein [Bacteroidota bacterium]
MFNTKMPMRDMFGKALLELGSKNSDVVVLTADLTDAIKTTLFSKAFPDRFFQMGIKESDMVGTAAGMAIDGLIPFVTTFAAFATSLANQSVRVSMGYNEANVKLTSSHGGICVGGDGATHQSFEDIALMRLIPGMTIVVPCDANEAYNATFSVAKYIGPVYLRLGRIPTPVITKLDDRFEIGHAKVLREGNDIAIVANGMMVAFALEAADALASDGIQARVINMHTVKPLDISVLKSAVDECSAIVTAEEHTIIGGLGGAVSEYIGSYNPIPIERVGVKDTFGESGWPDEILKKYGLTANDIANSARRVLTRKIGRSFS